MSYFIYDSVSIYHCTGFVNADDMVMILWQPSKEGAINYQCSLWQLFIHRDNHDLNSTFQTNSFFNNFLYILLLFLFNVYK